MSILFLIASLPAIALDSEPPLSPDDFAQRCGEWLGEEDCAAVRAILDGRPIDHPFVNAWLDKETILRNALVHIRARASGKDATLYTRYAHGCDKKIESEVEDAVQHHNPLEKERAIDRIRWESVEELQGPDPLSKKTIFAYAVKLAIVTRWSKRNTESGQESFGELSEVPITL